MKFHLPYGLFKSLMAVVCIPCTTLSYAWGNDALPQGEVTYTLVQQAAETGDLLKWDSTTGENAVWDTAQTGAWVDVSSGAQVTYQDDAHVEFGEGTSLNKNVEIAAEGVKAAIVNITDSGYTFSGGAMTVTESIRATESATINGVFDIAAELPNAFVFDVAAGKTLSVKQLDTHIHEVEGHVHGAFSKTGSGTLSITDSVYGTVTEATVSEGKLALGKNTTLTVGTIDIKGGTLENAQTLVSGEITSALTGANRTAYNILKSADGKHAAVLTDVSLHAGTMVAYATLQNVVFAGNSTLSGFITFEATQAQRELGVATDSTLKVENLTFDLHGIAAGENKVLIVNGALGDDAAKGLQGMPNENNLYGSLTGWDTVKYVYSGIAVNDNAVTSTVAGTVSLDADHDGNLYWDGSAGDRWDPHSTNWSLSQNAAGDEAFTALSHVNFGGAEFVQNRAIEVTQDMVVMDFNVTDGGYSFSGARVAALGDASFNFDNGAVTFNDQLVVQGNLISKGSGTLNLKGTTTVVGDMALSNDHITLEGDVSVNGSLSINAGSTTTAGSLAITGDVTAENIKIDVFAGDKAGSSYKEELVTVSGNLTASGNPEAEDKNATITLGGTAEQHYRGVITAGELIVNTQEHEVYFDHLHVDSLTVSEGAYAHVQTASASITLSTSTFPTIYLGGTLALDAAGATYDRGYNVYLQEDSAQLKFGAGTTIDNMAIIGNAKGSGYNDLTMSVQSGSATITKMEGIDNLTLKQGSLTVKEATGAVHGTLNLDNAKLKLADGVNNFMASDSGAIVLANNSRLNIGTTTQELSANNSISLSAASSITGEASGGLKLADGANISYAGEGNSISANMEVNGALGITSGAMGSSLNVSGLLSGNGQVSLSGEGKGTVAFSAENSFTGSVTVGAGSTLSLKNALTLAHADIVLDGGKLALNTDTAVSLDSLVFNSGSTLTFSVVAGTKEFSVADAALNVTGEAGATGSGVLNIEFSESLKTLTTYNLLTGLSKDAYDSITLSIKHNGALLGSSQYKVGYDAASGLLYIHTLMGNVWEGKSDYATAYQYGIWSTEDANGNWSDKSNYNENVDAAIFGDLDANAVSKVCIDGTVAPKDVYFVAENTAYEISALEGDNGAGHLDAGTNIQKDGKADVTLKLFGNADASTALGTVDIQDGKLILGESLAVSGSVTIADGLIDEDAITEGTSAEAIRLVLNGVSDMGTSVVLKMYSKDELTYTASAIGKGVSATLSGVTMDATGIRGEMYTFGSADKLLVQGDSELSYLNLSDFEAKGNVTLSNVILSSSDSSTSHLLENVTIGKGVVVDEDSPYSVVVDDTGNYTLSGNIVFEDTILNKGTVTLKDVTRVEIGKLKYGKPVVDSDGRYEYTYQLVKTEANGTLNAQTFSADQVFINGVNLATGLADGVAAKFNDNNGNGSFTVSVGNITGYDENGKAIVDGTVGMPQWDENWRKDADAPGISRLYVGSDESAVVELAAGKDWDSSYYKYGSIASGANNQKVNGGNGAIVVTLADTAKGELVAGSRNEGDNFLAIDHEVWIEDRSAIRNLVGGLFDWSANWGGTTQTGATHILVDSKAALNPDDVVLNDSTKKINDRTLWAKEIIIGGTRWSHQTAESFVTVRNGEIYTIFGASSGGTIKRNETTNEDEWGWFIPSKQIGTSHVFVDGGRIGEIFAAGLHSTLTGTQVVNGRTRATELVITGGTLGGENLRVFGGGERGEVYGDIYVRVEGNADIKSRLVGGSNAGYVKGNIEMDLISGTAFRVDAAGLGWLHYDGTVEYAKIEGNVRVNLYSDFQLGKGKDFELPPGIYGGMESTNYVTLIGDCTSTLHFAEGKEYKLGRLAADGYSSSDESIIVTGFDRFELEEKAHAVLALGYFDIDMDPNKQLYISGKGKVEVIGHGENFGRNITLENGATLKVSTSVIGDPVDSSDDRTITVTKGTTLDLTGCSALSGYETINPNVSPYAGLSFNTIICGDGVDGKGAIYKGTSHEKDDSAALSANKVSLPHVTLTGNASVGVMNHEVLRMCGYDLAETKLELNGYTFTKQGLGAFVARNVQMTGDGTVLVNQGDFYIDKVSNSPTIDFVMADGTSLYLNSSKSTEGTHSLGIRTLSGAGNVTLNNAALILHATGEAEYKNNYLDEKLSFDQFLSTSGFGYAVYSGAISSDDGFAGSLRKTGDGVHYLSGSESTYSGGTYLEKGRLYLLGTSAKGLFEQGSSTAASGVAGTGTICWTGADAELYLGHNARIFNEGITTNGVITIGVEGVLNSQLAGFVGIHSKDKDGKLTYVTMGGEEYVEIDTHNLKSIAVNAKYANGTDYKAGDEIDRNLMLLVKKSDWETAKSEAVTGFTDGGYNEAVYSGVLRDTDGVAAKLRKEGVGTLVVDQSNTYSGGTEIAGGTLRVRGWGTLGENVKDNKAKMTQEGSTLMFTYNTGYGDEPTELANDILLKGSGDARWSGSTATDGGTAALISAVGPASSLTLSGDISGDGSNVRHSGEGKLVLSGDNTYSGGTYVSRGTVEVQSATGLGSTADGRGAVAVERDADLLVSVESDYAAPQLITTLAAADDKIEGDVTIRGTETTERVLHMASNGYNAASTTLQTNGTLLIKGEAISAHSNLLLGSGSVIVSDASGRGSSAVFEEMEDYSGNFRIEGDNSYINVNAGAFSGGNISVSGQKAAFNSNANITIVADKSLHLQSAGDALTNTSAVVSTTGSVNIDFGGVLSVSNEGTEYSSYNLHKLEASASLNTTDVLPQVVEAAAPEYKAVGGNWKYNGNFDTNIAVNQQAAGAIKATDGLVLDAGATYSTVNSNISLMGGRLTLDTMESNLLLFDTTIDKKLSGEMQIVLFSDVSGVYFGYDNVTANADTGIYYTRADRYFAENEYINENTLLVYDSYAQVAYLHLMAIPEPTTATLSLMALAALAARRRRK